MKRIRIALLTLATLSFVLFGACKAAQPPRTGYVSAEEEGVMSVGLDDHDYDLAAQGVAREMLYRGLPRDFVVVLGPVDTRECPYDVRVRQLQKSLEVIFNKEGSLKFMAAVNAMAGGTEIDEIYKIIQFNWLNANPIDVEDLQTLGRLARINGILFGRVSSLERPLQGGGKEITYRFVWELANCENGLVELSHEEKIRKNVR